MTRSRRRQVGTTDDACSLCGTGPMSVIESGNVRSGLAWLRPGWDLPVHRYAECPGCGARHELAGASDRG